MQLESSEKFPASAPLPENVNRVRAEVAKVRRLCPETPICLHITKILCKRVVAKVVHTETPRRGKSQQQQTAIDQDGGGKKKNLSRSSSLQIILTFGPETNQPDLTSVFCKVHAQRL